MAIISKLMFNNGRVILKYANKHFGSMYSKDGTANRFIVLYHQTESLLCLRSVADLVSQYSE